MTEQTRLQTLLELVEQDPNDDFSRYGLALEYRKLEQFDKAHEQFNELIQRHPDYVPAYFMSGQMLAEQGEFEDAVARLKAGIETARRTGDRHAEAEMAELLESLEF